MPLYQCEACGCVENTALGFYWTRNEADWPAEYRNKKLCSECGPPQTASGGGSGFGAWHGSFPKRSAVGMLVDNEGFLWVPREDIGQVLPKHLKIVGIVGKS